MRLFEVIQLLEYNKGATLNNWGERIAKAAEFNRLHISDSWFTSNADMRNYDPKGPEADKFIAELVLEELEKMDPTKNKQYVMTLVRWYIGNIKKHKELQDNYDDWRQDANLDRYGEMDYEDSGYPEDYYDLESIADEFDDFYDDFGNYVMNAENLNTFMLEDAEQIKTALERYNSMKPQLQPNERDIGRFKTFYRFEDFVDSKMDPELKAEIENELLNRSDVKVLYNGPMGTVAIPYSHEASCKLGSGTKWCTTNRSPNLYNYYSSKGDLMIYNEKPGNEKYQIHVTLNGIEIRDSRDRTLPRAKYNEFTKTHPVISKLIQKKGDEIYLELKDLPYNPMEHPELSRNIGLIINWNLKHNAGPMRFVDEFYTDPNPDSGGISPYINRGRLPDKDRMRLLVKYSLSRGKQWPEMEDMVMKMLNSVINLVEPGTASGQQNLYIKSINRIIKQLEPYTSKYPWPELEEYKNQLLAKIQKPVQEASPGYGLEGKPEWYDRAVQMKLDNPSITAKEIARQVGVSHTSVVYWLTGKHTHNDRMIKRPKDSFPFEPGDFVHGGQVGNQYGRKYFDGAKPEWYDQALQMAKAGEKFNAIAKKFGVYPKTIGDWLVKGRKSRYGKIINPDAQLEPRRVAGQKLDINLLNSFIQDGYTDREIIELVADEKGAKIASQVKNMLPTLRKKLNPGTQVIDKTRSKRDPDITGLVQ